MAIEVYKTATYDKKPVIVTLEFLPDTIAASHGINAGRGDKFLVKKIENTLLTESYPFASSRYCIDDGFRPIIYRVGQIVKSPNFEPDLSKQMEGGIHFINDKKVAMAQEHIYWFDLGWSNYKIISLPDGNYTNYGNHFKKYAEYTIKNQRFQGNYYHYFGDLSIREHAIFDEGVIKEYVGYEKDGRVTKTIKNGITQCFNKNGCWKYEDKNNEIEWKIFNGKKTYRQKNVFINYYDTENIESKYYLDKDGKFHGEFVRYHPNGNMSAKCQYEHGVKIGKVFSYYENGNVQFIIELKKKDIWNILRSIFKKNEIDDCYVQEFDEEGEFVRCFEVVNDQEIELDETMAHLKNE